MWPVCGDVGKGAPSAVHAGESVLASELVEAPHVPQTMPVCDMCPRLQAPSTPDTTSRPELLVAHWPVLVLTGQQQPATPELLQLVQAMGGVSAIQDLPGQVTEPAADKCDASDFVHDLGAWLSYMSDASHSDAQLAEQMASVGTGLLVHCVEHGMAEVAQLIVTAMAAECSTRSSTAQGNQCAAWFLAAAKPADTTTPLLHAAMASGSADMLEKALR